MKLTYILNQASHEHWAVPHFNVGDFEQLRGVCEAAAKLRAPIMIGTSEGERDFFGLKELVALVRVFREKLDLPIFLNADHTKSVSTAKKAIDAGYDSIHIDLSREEWEKNLKDTTAVVKYARKKNPLINVEGELGYMVTESSQVYNKKIIPDPATFTNPEQAQLFVQTTGIDRFAPAVGNLHGIAVNRPKLDIKLIKTLRSILPEHIALVLHGGSGNNPTAFKKAIRAGINNIHISTELRIAYVNAERQSLKENPHELAPYKLATPVVDAVCKKAEYFIKLFGANNKA